MKTVQHFSLPVSGMKNGNHTFNFELDDSFFQFFENSLIQKGRFEARVEVDKRASLLVMDAWIKGYMHTSCDRCLADIQMPVESKSTIHVKPGNPDESDDEILYMQEDDTSLNIAGWLYESLLVSVPLIKVYDCEKEEVRPCNQEILKILEGSQPDEDENESGNVFNNIKL
jgi:uncharacterized metal-binding protein YceD (DUF177 family)